MLNIIPVRVSLANQDVAALLAEMEEAVAVNELAGCGCGCGCVCDDGIAESVTAAEVRGTAALIGITPEALAATINEALALTDEGPPVALAFNSWSLVSAQVVNDLKTCVYSEFGTNKVGVAVVGRTDVCPGRPDHIF